MTAGRSAHEVILYGVPGCHLCEEAARALHTLQRTRHFTLREIDIHTDSGLERRYLFEIPVIEVDGIEVTSAPININAVRLALTH